MIGWRSIAYGALALGVAGLGAAADAASPSVPGQLTYQGVLLDDQGMPQTGSIDLTLRLYDAVAGGTLLYVQTLAGVPLTDGVFTVTLGPTGAPTDTPTDPLTTSLGEALTGDLGATGPDRFLEVTVGLDGPLLRTQILSVPYALRAESATSADSAQTALVAETATNASNLGGLPSIIFTEIYEHTNLDGSGPPNTDPSEGTADTDDDGVPNFVDPDNDNDGLDDSLEVAQGSDINLVTPALDGVSPTSGFSDLSHVVTVTGSSFEPGLAVVFGAENPAPTNLSATSFEVTIGPAVPGPVDLQVTRLNGQQDFLANAFNFLSSVMHSVGTPSSFDAKQTGVTLLGATSDTYGVDLDGNGSPETEFLFPSVGQMAVAWNDAGDVVGVRCRSTTGGLCDIEFATDTDGDGDLNDETGVVVASPGSLNPQLENPSIAFDGSGRPVVGYIEKGVIGRIPYVAHDRNGDGSFAGELVAVELVAEGSGTLADVAVDPSDRAALLFYSVTQDQLKIAWDRNGDGDFGDSPGGTPELAVVASIPATPVCIAVGFSPAGELAALYNDGTNGLILGRDQNADGDFADAGETVVLDPGLGAGSQCDLASGDGNPLAVVYEFLEVRLLIDRNDDGDFADTDEDVLLANEAASALRAAYDDGGRLYVATEDDVYVDPTP